MTDSMTTAERLLALMAHLGLDAAHFATQVPADLGGLARIAPERIGGLVLCTPTRLDPAAFEPLDDRVLLISGARGISADVTARALQRLPGAAMAVLPDYEPAGWSDVVHDRRGEVVAAMVAFLEGQPGSGGAGPGKVAAAVTKPETAEGDCAGLSYRIEGDGPALILLPFFLAPSQWQPALDHLARRFTVITVAGPHVGGVAALEDRARAPTYRAMFRTLVELLAPAETACVLDVGCGSGALDRLLAERLGGAARIEAVDVNPFLLGEARALAEKAGVGDRIRFSQGSAVELPFPDATFDCAFSITVLEECDADRAIAEMIRVTKPGGRIGIIVRAIDLPQWWNLQLEPELAAKADVPPQSVGPGGVADASLYRRMRQAGLDELVAFPTMITLDRPEGPIWRYREDHVLSQLEAGETEAWRKAEAVARADGIYFQAHVLHAAVARKPPVTE